MSFPSVLSPCALLGWLHHGCQTSFSNWTDFHTGTWTDDQSWFSGKDRTRRYRRSGEGPGVCWPFTEWCTSGSKHKLSKHSSAVIVLGVWWRTVSKKDKLLPFNKLAFSSLQVWKNEAKAKHLPATRGEHLRLNKVFQSCRKHPTVLTSVSALLISLMHQW